MRTLSRFFVFGIGLLLSSSAFAEPSLKIVQPYENQKIPFVTSSFVFGSVVPATASLTINGVPVKPYKNGGFITMIPFQEGNFRIEAVADDGVSTATVTRMVQVAAAAKSFPIDHGKIEPLSPRTRFVLRPGDVFDVSFQAAPGGTATFRIEGKTDEFPMREVPGPVAGIYKGLYKIQANDTFEGDDILFYLKRADGHKIHQKAGAQFTVQRRSVPRFIELKERTTLLTGPGADYGYNMFLLDGVRLEVTGEWGDFYRVYVGSTDDGWIRKSAAIELPAGTAQPRSVSRNIRIDTTTSSTILELPLQYRHAHKVEELTNPARLQIVLFGVVADTDRIRYKSKKSVIKEVTWLQNNSDTCTLDIKLKQNQLWGYDVRYEGTKLVVEIRHAPNSEGAKGLRGLTVAVDAGHSPQSYGTIGPWGNTEASVNLAAAKVVRKELERRGATVVMIQDGSRDMSLQDRTDLAWKERAQLYISLHCDAVEDGVDPRDTEGFSVHYYHPQSRAFAEEVYKLYGANSGMKDQGLWRSNLSVCRMTQMPSLLLEMGFLVLPETEEKLVSPSFHQTVANIIANAISNFVKSE